MNSFSIDKVNKLIGVDESYQAPDALMKILWDKSKREKLFMKFLNISHNVSDDWFRDYFQDVQSDRGKKKQDFTPLSVSKLMVRLADNGSTYFEPAAGTGGILINRWNSDRLKTTPFDYLPSKYFYQVEELGDSAIPFLIFNILIRGMNATVVYGDSLSRGVKQVFFCQNENDDFLGFSSLNVMPHSEQVKKYFKVNEWVRSPLNHIESKKIPSRLSKLIMEADK